MRRRPPSRVSFTTKRAAPPASAASAANPHSLTPFLDRFPEGAAECAPGAGSRESVKNGEEVRCRLLQDAIDQISHMFEEAQQEYQGVSTNSPDWHKWKGEMIAYASVVAVLEDLKCHPVLVR